MSKAVVMLPGALGASNYGELLDRFIEEITESFDLVKAANSTDRREWTTDFWVYKLKNNDDITLWQATPNNFAYWRSVKIPLPIVASIIIVADPKNESFGIVDDSKFYTLNIQRWTIKSSVDHFRQIHPSLPVILIYLSLNRNPVPLEKVIDTEISNTVKVLTYKIEEAQNFLNDLKELLNSPDNR
ncbi:MAG: hypothetical protein U0694_25935 [Anaerolineae bacterium]